MLIDNCSTLSNTQMIIITIIAIKSGLFNHIFNENKQRNDVREILISGEMRRINQKRIVVNTVN